MFLPDLQFIKIFFVILQQISYLFGRDCFFAKQKSKEQNPIFSVAKNLHPLAS